MNGRKAKLLARYAAATVQQGTIKRTVKDERVVETNLTRRLKAETGRGVSEDERAAKAKAYRQHLKMVAAKLERAKAKTGIAILRAEPAAP